ncbi:hypothetical protein BLA6992_06842 [Burkholderia lata]|nr:hypothetical protein BLA6992_06842 [Burkholderia lata]
MICRGRRDEETVGKAGPGTSIPVVCEIVPP